ncbi:hypothetical protein D3C86_1520210 [compost metagenome]
MRASGCLQHLHLKPLPGKITLALGHIQRQIAGVVQRLGNDELFQPFLFGGSSFGTRITFRTTARKQKHCGDQRQDGGQLYFFHLHE